MRPKVAVLYGGISEERDVSCQSAASIATSIDKEKYNVCLIAITSQGEWYMQSPRVLEEELPSALPITVEPSTQVSVIPGRGLWIGEKDLAIDLAFTALHGTQGEDGTVQGALEVAQIAYVGAGVCASAVCMHKVLARRLWTSAHLPVVPSINFRYRIVDDPIPSSIQKMVREFSVRHGFPLFVKPSRSGSSAGITKLHSLAEFAAALRAAAIYDEHILVEKGIEGREMEYAVLGNQKPEVSPAGEIVSTHEFYDYSAKYLDTHHTQLIVPADIPAALDKKIRQTVQQAYQICEVSGLARIELFIDSSLRFYLNEINTMPGFTSHSIFPSLWKARGYQMNSLIDNLLRYARERHNEYNVYNRPPVPS